MYPLIVTKGRVYSVVLNKLLSQVARGDTNSEKKGTKKDLQGMIDTYWDYPKTMFPNPYH